MMAAASMEDLISYWNAQIVPPKFDTPLQRAIGNQNASKVKKQLDNGANPNEVNKMGCTTLSLAIWVGHNKIVKILLDHGAEVNQIDPINGTTALMFAAQDGKHEIARDLLLRGASVNYQAVNGRTALHSAVQEESAATVNLLLEFGANVHLTSTNDKSTPLHVACGHRNLNIVKMLVNAGADVNAKRTGGVTPLYMATGNGFTEITHFLAENGADIDGEKDTGSQKVTEVKENKQPMEEKKLEGSILLESFLNE